MNLKAVELQIAIPKTFEAGKVAENHQQHVSAQQVNANETLKKEIERKAVTVNESEELLAIADEEERSSKDGQERGKGKKRKHYAKSEMPAQHPFKGNLFDYSG